MNMTEERMNVAQVDKADCISIQEAVRQLNTNRNRFYNYMNILRVPRYRYPLDKNTYILKSDFEKIKSLMESRGR